MISALINTSKQVIKDCSLQNGAIVASNSRKPYFPKDAKNYYFVWPRDALYICRAADMLGLEIRPAFLRWCMKAEELKKTGLFYEKYHINGKPARHNLQPDQTGSVLINIHDHNYNNDTLEFTDLINACAEGLCNIWQKDHFSVITQDLWEERFCFPDLKDNFLYSLAMCARVLELACEMLPNKSWKKTSEEMRMRIERVEDHFSRTDGLDKDIDASLLGLVWPGEVIEPDNSRMKKTIRKMEKDLAHKLGVHRYEKDRYDGWIYAKMQRDKGAGYWPLLNFWMTIYYARVGHKRKAMKYYDKVLQDMNDLTHIPEQIFSNDIQVSVSPLCWSHAMFILASKELAYI